jgi:alpha-glucosidase (family GH31 glycosyl hydrolase)
LKKYSFLHQLNHLIDEEEVMYHVMLKTCSALFVLTCTIFGWTSGNLTVTVTNSPMDINVAAGGTTLADITGLKLGTTSFSAISSVSSTTDSMVLTLSANYSLTIKTVSGGLHFLSNSSSVTTVEIDLKDQGEHFYGITEQLANMTTPDLRGKSGFKDQVAAYQVSSGDDAEVYEGFYYTTLGYAGYFDTFAYGSYNFGVLGTGTTIIYNTSMINWYLFYGPKLSQIQQSFYKVIGAPKKVPMWACGPVVWHDNFPSSAAMIADADSFTTVKIPFSTLWLDRPYNNGTNGWGNMNFEGAFASPDVWIKTLANTYFINLVTWVMPGCFSAPPAGVPYLTSKNYYLDLTSPAAVTWYKNQLQTGQYAFGVKGHKMDRVDNGWVSGDGIVSNFPALSDGTLEPERHKKYAYLNCQVTDDALRTTAGLGNDQFTFPRCAVGRCQQYVSALWNGDTEAGYSGLITSLGNALRAAFLGFPMWGSDIGGYNAKSKVAISNLCHWMLFGVYSGFMEFMIDFKGPWIYTATEQSYIQSIFNQRFNLLPYVYSIINTAADNGVTMKPLVGEYPSDSKTYTLTDEYLFGPAMLVAPLTSDATSRSLYLPAGSWINMYDYSDVQTGGTTITSPTMSMTQIPVYIKSNSIYPTGKVFAGLEKKWNPTYDNNRTVSINVFPGAAGESSTFTYVDYIDGDKQKVLSVSVSTDNTITVTAPAMTVSDTVYIRLPAAPIAVFSGSTAIASPQYDATAKKLTVGFAANQPVSVTVNPKTKVLDLYEPLQAHGKILAKQVNRGIEMTIPRITGIGQTSMATIAVFDMAGRNIVKSDCELKQYGSTSVILKLSKGAYIAKVEVNGILAGNAKLMVQ